MTHQTADDLRAAMDPRDIINVPEPPREQAVRYLFRYPAGDLSSYAYLLREEAQDAARHVGGTVVEFREVVK